MSSKDKYVCFRCKYSTSDKKKYNNHIISKKHENMKKGYSITRKGYARCTFCNNQFPFNEIENHIKSCEEKSFYVEIVKSLVLNRKSNISSGFYNDLVDDIIVHGKGIVGYENMLS